MIWITYTYHKLQLETEQTDTNYWPLRVLEDFYGQRYWPGRSVDTTWRHGGHAPLTPGTCTSWGGTYTDAAGALLTGDTAVKKIYIYCSVLLGEKRFLIINLRVKSNPTSVLSLQVYLQINMCIKNSKPMLIFL